MDDLLSKYSANANPLVKNEEIDGTVIKITKNEAYIDIGRKTEGLIAEKAFKEAREYISKLKVGDTIRTFVIIPETREGYTILSLRHAIQSDAWDKLAKHLEEDTEVSVSVKSVSGAGVITDVYGMTGFIPNSLLAKEHRDDPNKLLGAELKVKIVELHRNENKIVLSETAVSDASEIKAIKDAFEKIDDKKVYKGIITKIIDFGVFVKIPVDVSGTQTFIEGLVHVSELSWGKTADVKASFKVGDSVNVSVIGKDDHGKGGRQKLSLSIKKTQDDPWKEAVKKYAKDSTHTGTVSKVSDYGVFIVLESGIEGLLHVTKIPPNSKLTVGSEAQVYIEEVDIDQRKISLGLKLTSKPLGYK